MNNSTNNSTKNFTSDSRFSCHCEETKTNFALAGDLLCGDWKIVDNIKYYSLPRNVILLRLKALAYQAVQIAKIDFDKDSKNHAMLISLQKSDNIDETAKKFGVGRNEVILTFAEIAYNAIDKAYEAGFEDETLFKTLAYNNNGNGPKIKEAVERVAKEAERG